MTAHPLTGKLTVFLRVRSTRLTLEVSVFGLKVSESFCKYIEIMSMKMNRALVDSKSHSNEKIVIYFSGNKGFFKAAEAGGEGSDSCSVVICRERWHNDI